MIKKGIILAGGRGTRLFPLTLAVSKQLLPVYDKPMIYYPLTTLMLAGIRDYLIISSPDDMCQYKKLLGDGSQWGITLHYCIQPSPDGLPQAFILGEKFISDEGCALILGDNIFYGSYLSDMLHEAVSSEFGGTVFAYRVKDPERYGVVEFDKDYNVLSIEEKPKYPKSFYALTGLYFFDKTVVNKARQLIPSQRGELEIVDLMKLYLNEEKLKVQLFGRGFAWLDTGTHEALSEAGTFIEVVQKRQGLMVACPEEIAFRSGWIDESAIKKMADRLRGTYYAMYLESLLR